MAAKSVNSFEELIAVLKENKEQEVTLTMDPYVPITADVATKLTKALTNNTSIHTLEVLAYPDFSENTDRRALSAIAEGLRNNKALESLRVYHFGMGPDQIEPFIRRAANPHLLEFGMMRKGDDEDFGRRRKEALTATIDHLINRGKDDTSPYPANTEVVARLHDRQSPVFKSLIMQGYSPEEQEKLSKAVVKINRATYSAITHNRLPRDLGDMIGKYAHHPSKDKLADKEKKRKSAPSKLER